MECAQSALSEVGDNHPILLTCQKELGHQLPLSSYLLKPMQRLTKYQLLLKVSHLNININRPEHSPISIFGIICILCWLFDANIQLLFQDLSETFTSCANGQFELEESVEAMLEVIKAVNDSLHQINIKVSIKIELGQ